MLKPKWDINILLLASRLRFQCKEKEENCKRQRWWMTSKKCLVRQNREDIHMNSQGLTTYKTHTALSHVNNTMEKT